MGAEYETNSLDGTRSFLCVTQGAWVSPHKEFRDLKPWDDCHVGLCLHYDGKWNSILGWNEVNWLNQLAS